MLVLLLWLNSLLNVVTPQRHKDFAGIGGVHQNGSMYLYNSQLTSYWVPVQPDPIKVTKAELSPIDGRLYGLESSGIIYSKTSLSDRFIYVQCCATTFTFVENMRGLPNTVRLLLVDYNVIYALRDFGDTFLSFDTDESIVSMASVNGEVAVVTESGALYRLGLHNGVTFEDMTPNLPTSYDKDEKSFDIISIDAWKSKGKFLAVNRAGDVWSSSDLVYWESFGNGRSCCVASIFEVEETVSFAEQTFPFCTQSNYVKDMKLESNGRCRIRDESFGKTIYTTTEVELPCVHYINSSVTELSTQDKFGDYKIAVSAKFTSYPASRIGIAFNLVDEQNYDFIYISPNERDCYGMGYMAANVPIFVENVKNVGCPGGAPLSDQLFNLEVQTVEGQVIVKFDGYTIFSRYPRYDNLAAGGVLVWPMVEGSSDVVTYGFGVCYVAPEGLSIEQIFGVPEPTPPGPTRGPTSPISPEGATFGDFTTEARGREDLRETTMGFTLSTEVPIVMETEAPKFDNNIEEVGDGSKARIELLSEGIRYIYYLYKENKGFTAANKACERLGMELLLIEDEIQNNRIRELMNDLGVEMVWLGKFWIEEWVITLNDGTRIDWNNFEVTPPTVSSPIFAAIRADGYWDAVEGGNRFNYICQQAYPIEIREGWESNEVKKIEEIADDAEISGSFEEGIEHPPVIVKGPVNITAQVGDTVTFKCTSSSRPPATVIITKMEDEKEELPSIGDPTSLNDESTRVTTIIELESVTMEDAGKYTCVAGNSLGYASESAWLHIEEVPEKQERNICSMWGDPHMQTYDGNTFNFPGTCTYILSMDCTSSSFWIYGLFRECGGGGVSGPSISATDSLTIYYRVADGNQTGIELQRGWVVNIGGSKLRIGEGMSARHGNLAIRRTAEHLVVTLPNKIVIQWDGLQMAVIMLPDDFPLDKTCGLCGRYNDNKARDYYMRFGRTDYTDNALEFGNTWKFSSYQRPCPDVPLEDVDPCEYFPERKTEGEILCQQNLYQVPFTSCHEVVEPALYYQNCVRDWCGSEWRREQNLPLCNALSAYATECELRGVPISSWRSSDLCPIEEIKEITKEEGCPWEDLEFDFERDE